jgi:membrane protease YdiL (CAAX protease family)
MPHDAAPPQRSPDPQLPPDDSLARRLRGFGPVGVLAALIILALGSMGGLAVLGWAHLSRTPWRDIGYVRPASWVCDVAIGIAFGITFKLAMKSLVMPLLGAEPINQAYHYLAGNTAALPGMVFWLIFAAGFGEETVFRGFLFERLGRLFGHGPRAKIGIVLLTSALFGVIHYPEQGLAGVQQATIVGLVFGTIFAVRGRLWLLMIAHAAFDLTALAIIYWDLEASVARWIFR